MLYFDIGANIGKWSLSNIDQWEEMNEINKKNKIIAVEASPNTFKKLVENVHHESRIVCLQYAVCDSTEDSITFYDSQADTLSTINKDWLDSEESRFYEYATYHCLQCPTITLDKLMEEYGVPHLIKIDVEGGELECIRSLTQKVDQICFEWASEMKDIACKCMDYLTTLGYTEFSIQSEDNYTYRPTHYTDADSVKRVLAQTTPKNEWGMIWAR